MLDQATDTQAAAYLLRKQTFKFMPIPMIEHNAEWFDAGAVSFAVEVRVLAGMGEASGEGAGGGTIHVFSPDHQKERVRCDCIHAEPHYHYLDQRAKHDNVWTYDDAVESCVVDEQLCHLECLCIVAGKWNRNSCWLSIWLIGKRCGRYAVEGSHNSRTWKE